MRATLKHPRDPNTIAAYGYNNGRLGFWLEVRTGGRLVAERDLTTEATSLPMILATLVDHGFFTADDVDEAKAALGYCDVDDLEGGVAAAGEVLVQLRMAAGGPA